MEDSLELADLDDAAADEDDDVLDNDIISKEVADPSFFSLSTQVLPPIHRIYHFQYALTDRGVLRRIRTVMQVLECLAWPV